MSGLRPDQHIHCVNSSYRCCDKLTRSIESRSENKSSLAEDHHSANVCNAGLTSLAAPSHFWLLQMFII